MKHGALTPCPECGFDPEEDEDRAKAMIVTDHFLPIEELETVAGRIKSGEPVIYPEDTVKQFIQTLEENPDLLKPASLSLGWLVAIVVAIAALIWFIIT
jgi:hypothetical protein